MPSTSPSRQPLLPPSERVSEMSRSGSENGWRGDNARRIGVFVMAVIVGLASGSNYVYSAYAPQLASQLRISSTQVNLVGLAGNLGMYLTGPLWGKVVDSRGQQAPLLIGSILLFTGYTLMHQFYTLSIPIRLNPSSSPSTPLLSLLCLSMFLTGCGGSAGLSSSVNAIAKSFPDATRASATGTVLAGFGLSAFLFSTIGHWVWGGDAGGLLALLAFGTGLPMFIGSFVVRPVPPHEDVQTGYEPISNDEEEEETDQAGYINSRTTSLELSRSRSPLPPRGRPQPTTYPSEIPFSQQTLKPQPQPRNSSLPPSSFAFTPLQLMYQLDFWILFTILALLCGTGLMYINNAGTVALALARMGKVEYNRRKVSAWQAKQVGVVSVWNCAGRILGGIFSDTCKSKFQMKRIWFLPIVALIFIASQLAGQYTTNVKHLWIVSTMLGLAYGSLFNVLPMLVLEWFGMAHFSQNYGWICVAPVIGGNVFNLLFGRVYDSNTIGRVGTPEAGIEAAMEVVRRVIKRDTVTLPGENAHDCLAGVNCYASAMKVATVGCSIAFVLSVWAGIRRERKIREVLGKGIEGLSR